MSPIGHNITAFAMATTYMRISDVPWGEGFSSLPTVIMTGNAINVDHFAFVTLVALGMLVGARGPDRLEIPTFNRRTQTRRSVIPHRTLTHWPIFWLVLTGLCLWIWSQSQDLLFYMITSVGLGFCAAGWLHLVMDIMTPAGIPLLSPFGSRSSLSLYKTSMKGSLITGEWLCIFIFCIICLFFSKIIS
jgi:hypothetical protein